MSCAGRARRLSLLLPIAEAISPCPREWPLTPGSTNGSSGDWQGVPMNKRRQCAILLSIIALAFALHLVDAHSDQGKSAIVTPPLSPRDEMATFKFAPGYRVELVAAEPLVHDPVALTFDPDGRIWVVEMRGFMPDVDGSGEKNPVGTVSVLEDTDGDGIMDKSTLFLDKLVMPRAVCWTMDGMLVAENGNIWLCQVKNLKCAEKKLICNYNVGTAEHA